VDLYSASLRLLLRSAPDSSTAKKNSFKARVECVRVNPEEQSQCQWKPTELFLVYRNTLHSANTLLQSLCHNTRLLLLLLFLHLFLLLLFLHLLLLLVFLLFLKQRHDRDERAQAKLMQYAEPYPIVWECLCSVLGKFMRKLV